MLVLYTKSYIYDIERINNLLLSIEKYNVDNIPMYLSVPIDDLSKFKNRFNFNFLTIISDSDIINEKINNNWYSQQIIKSSFWKLNVCDNYVMIDSDSYFIRDFHIHDFMYDSFTPYTVMHQQTDLFEWSSKYKNIIGFDPKKSFESDRLEIMNLFDRSGRIYDFGPSPVIWSSIVWSKFEEMYLIPNNLKFSDIIYKIPSEFSWYGEFLLKTRVIDIVPVGPLFKVFHYEEQYNFYKQLNYTESNFSENYMGIVLQSNFTNKITY